MIKLKWNILFFILVIAAAIGLMWVLQGYAADVAKYIPDAEVAEKGLSLWQIMKAGGEIMIVLSLLSIAALALVIYYLMTIKKDKIIPEEFLENVTALLEKKEFYKVKKSCQDNPNFISGILSTGLNKIESGKYVMEEAMQNEGRRQIAGLWQKLSYLGDIAVISPMVGLLGTVLGMIQAFNVIAFQTGAVKPILLAGGISKAMVTTAAGLIIAIPAMIFYAFFRGRIQDISSHSEGVASELLQVLSAEGTGKKK